MSERLFRVTYSGDDVYAIPKVGVFQNGTSAVVTEAVAEIVKAHAKFTIAALDGGGAPKPAPTPAPTPAPAPEKQEAKETKGNKDKNDKGAKEDKGGKEDKAE